SYILNLEASYLNLLSTARKLKASALSLEYSQETYNQMQERYRNGLISGTDLLDADVALNTAQVNEISSKFTYLKTRSALKKLLGLADDETIISMIMEN
ncbi:MAG: TolC family protein, partial [Candidatus Cloacimonetes bacterium]|nr:TolC family protein [Candidatus Cloacimonadota bacterium]